GVSEHDDEGAVLANEDAVAGIAVVPLQEALPERVFRIERFAVLVAQLLGLGPGASPVLRGADVSEAVIAPVARDLPEPQLNEPARRGIVRTANAAFPDGKALVLNHGGCGLLDEWRPDPTAVIGPARLVLVPDVIDDLYTLPFEQLQPGAGVFDP